MTRILAFESSCDETSASVAEFDNDKRRILSNIVASQASTHALYGGVVPEIASRAHCEVISRVTKSALEEASLTMKDIDCIAVTYAPGLIGPLLVGVSFAKSLAYANNIPLVPVNHIRGHVAAAYYVCDSLRAPFMALVVSGGHTSIFNVTSPVTFDQIGSTRDDAAGEAFDKVGRMMGLSYPCGRMMDELASYGETLGVTDRFPSPAINDGTLDMSFSGIKTFAVNQINSLRQKERLGDDEMLPREEAAKIAFAFSEAVCGGIASKLESAVLVKRPEKIVMAGGVAANSHLRKKITALCKKYDLQIYIPPVSLCGDNAAMIAAQGYYQYLSGHTSPLSLNAYASDEAPEY